MQSGGIVSATTIGSTGSALITSGGASIDPIISGGTLELLSGASLGSSAITFAGSGGTLLLDSGVVPANTISGFARGDVIDLSGVDFAGGTVTLLAGNVLELSVNAEQL